MTTGDPLLCFIANNCAYFTTQPLSEQWGDDWEDSPYEHNAGTPYQYHAEHDGRWYCYGCHRHTEEEPTCHPDAKKTPPSQPWEIVQLYVQSDLVEPREDHFNSPYSVEAINAGAVPWLRSSRWSEAKYVSIWAGTPLRDFVAQIEAAGGKVYMTREDWGRFAPEQLTADV